MPHFTSTSLLDLTPSAESMKWPSSQPRVSRPSSAAFPLYHGLVQRSSIGLRALPAAVGKTQVAARYAQAVADALEQPEGRWLSCAGPVVMHAASADSG